MANSAQISIEGDNKPLKKSLEESRAMFTEWGVAIKTNLIQVGIQIGQQLAGSITSGFRDLMEKERVLTLLDARLKSLGPNAQASADDIIRLADALEPITNFDAESIVRAQTSLLNFTNVLAKDFERVTRLALDMAEANGTDAAQGIDKLGKALANPLMGIRALRIEGVNFTDQQEKLITTLVEAGKTADAQALLLAELEKRYKGTAEAAGKTLAGELDNLQTEWDDAVEVLLEGLIPALKEVMPWLKSVAQYIKEEVAPAFVEWINKTKELAGELEKSAYGGNPSQNNPFADAGKDEGEAYQRALTLSGHRADAEEKLKKLLRNRDSEWADESFNWKGEEQRLRRLIDDLKFLEDDAMRRGVRAEQVRKGETPEQIKAKQATEDAATQQQAEAQAILDRQKQLADDAAERARIRRDRFLNRGQSNRVVVADQSAYSQFREWARNISQEDKGFAANIESFDQLANRISATAASQSPEIKRLDTLIQKTEEQTKAFVESGRNTAEVFQRLFRRGLKATLG